MVEPPANGTVVRARHQDDRQAHCQFPAGRIGGFLRPKRRGGSNCRKICDRSKRRRAAGRAIWGVFEGFGKKVFWLHGNGSRRDSGDFGKSIGSGREGEGTKRRNDEPTKGGIAHGGCVAGRLWEGRLPGCALAGSWQMQGGEHAVGRGVAGGPGAGRVAGAFLTNPWNSARTEPGPPKP